MTVTYPKVRNAVHFVSGFIRGLHAQSGHEVPPDLNEAFYLIESFVENHRPKNADLPDKAAKGWPRNGRSET